MTDMETASSLLENYDALLARAKELVILMTASGVLEWDMETKMPPRGIILRSQQLSLLSQFAHRLGTDPVIGSLISKIESDPGFGELNEVQRRNVHLIRKNYEEQTKLPEKLVAETARQRAIAIDVWKKAKASRDFSLFRPELEKVVDLKAQAAVMLKDVKGSPTPYDALVDDFEPRMTAAQIGPIFDELKAGLISITQRCQASPRQPNPGVLERFVPMDVQRRVAESLASFVLYDVKSGQAGGRIDETEHPFTQGYYDDVRITTHYHEKNPTSSIFSVLHEAGHATYEQNLPGGWMYQPVGAACSSGFHESQSRFVENIVGRSTEFWSFYLPKLKELTDGAFADVDLGSFVRAINQVKPSKIRVEADEVTYCLHIIVRFELERDIFAGKVKVSELPQLWNEKYAEYLGVKIENDSEGVMQDTHWAATYFGYFPSYALGNVYSGQILHAMERDLPDWRNSISRGDFSPVRGWLREHLYSLGNLYDPTDLLRRVTGEDINVRYYLDYLRSKYGELYGF